MYVSVISLLELVYYITKGLVNTLKKTKIIRKSSEEEKFLCYYGPLTNEMQACQTLVLISIFCS